MLADVAKCKVLNFIYDYTTRYRMDMSLNVDKKYLVNQFLRDSILSDNFDEALLPENNPCNINPSCLIADENCSEDGEVTVSPCTLQITGFSIVQNYPTYGFVTLGDVTFIGETGVVTYLWDFPFIDDAGNLDAILSLQAAITPKTSSQIKVQFVATKPIPLQTVQNITCTITDETGCSSSITCPIIFNLNPNQEFTLYCGVDLGGCIEPDWEVINITSTNLTVLSGTYIGNLTVDIQIFYGLTEVFVRYGEVLGAPYIVSGLFPDTDYDVVMTIHCPDGTLEVQTIPIHTLP